MTDPTVVSLCKQYLQTWDNTMLPLLADRLEELGWNGGDLNNEYTTWLTFNDMAALRRRFNGLGRRDVTVPAILNLYNGGEP